MKKNINGVLYDIPADKLREMQEFDKTILPAPDPMQERMEKQEQKLDSIEGLCNSILSLLRGGR